MKIEIKVKPGSKKEEVLPLSEGVFKVSVKEKALEGQANEAVREAIAEYFKVSRSKVQFLSGLKSKTKRLEILV
jgi:uncharacterized protein